MGILFFDDRIYFITWPLGAQYIVREDMGNVGLTTKTMKVYMFHDDRVNVRLFRTI